MSELRVDTINEATSGEGTTISKFANPASSFRNLIINGDMQIAQRGTSQTGVANNSNEGYNTLDRFALNFFGNEGGAATVSQDTTVPSDTTYGKFSKSIKIDVTTADTSIGVTGSHSLQQNIEASFIHHSGWDYTNSSSKITLSFWARSVKAGDYCVNLQATDATRYFVAQYTLVANTWKHIEVVIPGNSDLVFNDDNGEGLQVRWMLSTGDDRDGATADTWFNPGSNFFQSTSSQVNFFDSTDNEFFLTGVQLEVGDIATVFEHLPHDVQLKRCQRYCFVNHLYSGVGATGGAGSGQSNTTTRADIPYHFPTTMRAIPTLSVSDATKLRLQHAGSITTLSSIAGEGDGTNGSFHTIMLYCTVSSGLTAGRAVNLIHNNASVSITCDSEL